MERMNYETEDDWVTDPETPGPRWNCQIISSLNVAGCRSIRRFASLCKVVPRSTHIRPGDRDEPRTRIGQTRSTPARSSDWWGRLCPLPGHHCWDNTELRISIANALCESRSGRLSCRYGNERSSDRLKVSCVCFTGVLGQSRSFYWHQLIFVYYRAAWWISG